MAAKKMTDKQQKALTMAVGKEILELAEKRGCEIKVVPLITPDGRIAASMHVCVKDQIFG